MSKRIIFDDQHLQITISRLCEQLIENDENFDDVVIIGMQPRGIYLAERIQSCLKSKLKINIPIGQLDTTFYRDDFRRRDEPIQASKTEIPFLVENKKVILVDDVLFTGRTVRAAMDAIISFGRPKKVEFLVLVDRKYSRELPIEADYVGMMVNTILSQKVLVELKEQGHKEDNIWLIEKGKE